MVYRKSTLIKRIEKLREYKNDLISLKIKDLNEYLQDKKIRYSTERLLFLIAEGIIDFLDHILTAKYEIVSSGYEDVIRNAYENSLISDNIYEKLRGLDGFRNILAYNYLDIDNEIIYKNYLKMKDTLGDIIDTLEH